ncbi:protein BTN1 [Nematostella vectensis]|uniref:protein BTN1 n=1 Tax=Nematostella vectensis TaxID=45351 RepID=UPI00138FE1FF|nr:protein BTN1 [Nematostella vectensis]XP_032230041.1 protein BTN1 [Nematostella vectensis]
MDQTRKQSHPVLWFFAFGLLTMVYDEMCLTAAQDFLSGSKIATTTVILCIAIPVIAVKSTIPWVTQRVPYNVKIPVITFVFMGGLLTLVLAPRVGYRLVGVSVVEVGVACSEITIMSLTAFYGDVTVDAFVAGIGMSSLFGPFYYTALTTWIDLSPRTTVMSTIPWPLFLLVLFGTLDKGPLKHASQHKRAHLDQGPKTHDSSKSSQLTEGEKSEEMRDKQGGVSGSSGVADINGVETAPKAQLSMRDKLSVALEISPLIFSLFLTYFCEYLSNHAVITTLAFPNSTFSPRDHYPYYILIYNIGKFIGRSHIFFFACLLPSLLPYILVRQTWRLAILEFVHFVLFLSLSWFRFIPYVSAVLVLCFTEGFIAGSIYVNSVHTVSKTIAETKRKEFALGLITIGNAVGKMCAGFVGLWQEPWLRTHCIGDLKLGAYCFTRHDGEIDRGWEDR